MNFGNAPTDFVADLPMDIPPAFYPPPTVIVPRLNIPPLRKYEYKFERERAAIQRWEKERLVRLTLAEEAEKEKRCKEEEEEGRERRRKQREEIEEGRRVEEEQKQRNREEDQKAARCDVEIGEEKEMPKSKTTLGIGHQPPQFLRPTPVSQSASMPSSSSQLEKQSETARQKSLDNNYTLNEQLEEFLPRRDLFDILELKSLDDWSELEKLLPNIGQRPAGSTSSLPITAVNEGHQSPKQGGITKKASINGSSFSTNVLM